MSGENLAAYIAGVATLPLLLFVVAVVHAIGEGIRDRWTNRKPAIQTIAGCRKCHKRFSYFSRRQAIRALRDHDCAGKPPRVVPSEELIPNKGARDG